MRIRKNASKILGTASVFPSYSPPAAAQIWSSPPPNADSGLLCELNRSSWDVLPTLPSPPSNDLHDNPKEVENEMENGGNTGNDIKCEEKHPYSDSTNTAITSVLMEELTDKDAVERRKKSDAKRTTAKKKSSGTTKAAAGSTATNVRCKKSDGKTWKCKRRAQHPHTLCEYHINQIRSYNHSYKLIHKVQPPRARVKKRRNTTAEEAAAGAPSNYVFYYNGFGPWRGKRRGHDGGEGSGAGGATKEEEQEQKEQKGKQNSESGDAHDASMVDEDDACNGLGDAEDDQRGRGHTDGESDSVEKAQSDEEGYMEDKMSANPRYGKRRRKRVKARSLKSLL